MLGAGGALLAACGGTSNSGSTSSANAGLATSSGGGVPVRGGTLRVGMISGGPTETLIPGAVTVFTDILRTYQLFDRLFENVVTNGTLGVGPGLAASAEPNADASVWTLHLRPGVTWHDGKPLTADDVLWTIASWASTTNYASAYAYGRIDFKGVRKRDSLTVEVPLVAPLAEFPSVLSQYNFGVIQHGSTPKSIERHPVGTGPFKYVSFTPGSQSVFTANPNYWQHGKPYLNQVVIDSSYTDATAQQNALLGGTVDAINYVDAVFARSQASGGSNTVLGGGVSVAGSAPGAYGQVFVMRVDKPPFNDVKVRQAFKLMIDRPAMIDSVADGYGAIGNDTWGFGTQYFDASLVPTHDPEKARALLKAAGQEGLSVTLQTTDAPYLVSAATLLAQQAAAIGVKINVQQTSLATYFTPTGGFLSGAFRQDEGATYPSMSTAYLSYLATGAPYNDTHWSDTGLIAQAMAATDPSKAQDLWYAAQRQQVSEGGTILWTNLPYLDVVAKDVHGLQGSAGGALGNYRLLDAWIAKT
jgi:peptide/nickel transport system substrate-binding protein